MNPFSETRKDRGGRTQDLVSATVEERRGFLISAPVLRGHRPGLGRWPSGMWSPLLNDLHHCSPTPSHGRPAHGAWDMRGPPPRASAEPPARSRAPRLRTPGRPGPRLLTPQPDSRLCCCAQFSGCSVTPAPPYQRGHGAFVAGHHGAGRGFLSSGRPVPGSRASGQGWLRSGPDGRGSTGRLVTWRGPSGGYSRPPVRAAWPKSVGQPRGPGSGAQLSKRARARRARRAGPVSRAAVWLRCWLRTWGLSAAGAWWSSPTGAEGRRPVTPRQQDRGDQRARRVTAQCRKCVRVERAQPPRETRE